jgi:hypothetical protein
MLMFLKRLKVSEFINEAGDLWQEMRDNFKSVYGYWPSDPEVNSWRKSYPALAEVLARASMSVGDCYVYLEYVMPGASLRADVLVVGTGPDGHRAAVVIELKGWRGAGSILIDGHNLKVGSEVQLHPSDQALGYRDYLVDLSEAFVDLSKTVKSCSYLHELISTSIRHLIESPFDKLTELSPVFTADRKGAMAEWLSGVLVDRPDSRYLSELDAGRMRISKNLFSTVETAIKEQPAWTLLEEQKAAFNQILDLATRNDGEKHLVLVKGGPGTGKSVIAMQVLGELNRRKIPSVHITNSSSFTTVMKSLIVQRGDRAWGTNAVEGLFRLSHNWVRKKDDFEVAVCDEAHRFRKSTTLRPFLMSKRPQAEEIMEHVRVLVAFIDERQILRKAEAGNEAYFKQCAINVGVKPENIHGPIELKAQFRSAGNEDFVKALDEALYNDNPVGFSHRNFDVRIHNSVESMEEYLRERVDAGFSARVVAGFCWPWSDPEADGSLVTDVRVGGWGRAWNRKAEKKRKYPSDQHPYTLWARRKDLQLEEVGCIYSAQGFDFDYVGVIWGPDLVWRGGKWIAQPDQSRDSEMKHGRRPIRPEVALPLLKNAYRVLCSRGMRGCSIYCTDEETATFLRKALAA